MRRLLFLMLLASGLSTALASGGPVEVGVDRRVELAAVVARLAGFEEFAEPGIATYDAEVEAWFAPYADAPAVSLLRQLRQTRGIGYGDTVSLALLAGGADWQPRIPLTDWLPAAQTNWDEASAAATLKALAAFAETSRADAFFERQHTLYREIEAQLDHDLARILDTQWFSGITHEQAGKVRFKLVPALLHGRGNYGPRINLADGSIEAHAVIGPPVVAAGQPIAWSSGRSLRLLVHEFAHAFVNPWVDAHASTLQADASALFDASRTQMQGNAYGSWEIMLYESLVRAVTLRYFLEHALSEEADASRRIDTAQGFGWTAELAELLARQDTGNALLTRERAPAIAALLRTQAQAQAARQGPPPSIVALSPAHGADQVDPATSTLEIGFDRPMDGGLGIFGDDDHPDPDYTGKPEWDAERRSVRVPVKLMPGTRYRLELNHPEVPGGFQSAEGIPLSPVEWTFRTRD